MTNINPINSKIGANPYLNLEPREEQAKEAAKKSAEAAPKKQVTSEEFFDHLAAVNSDIVPARAQKTVNVSEYVDDVQAARIADSMAEFEANFDEAFAMALDEFPDITKETAKNIALAYIDSTY